MKTWLILDCHYLCHRAFHSIDLAFGNKPIGVIFGFLKSISFLKDRFQTDDIVFCFENRYLFRTDIYPPYKQHRNRKKRTPEEVQLYKSFHIQISELRRQYLPKIGFKNIFSFRGMESDDIMAAIAKNLPNSERAIIVTSDSDLYQCIKPNVWMYSPTKREVYTQEWFLKKYKIYPKTWAVVKAIAGCVGDEVKGINGIGEVTALKYVRGDLKTASVAYRAIQSKEGRRIVRRNRRLVQLPYEDCPVPELRRDNITNEAWLEVCDELGMRHAAARPPILLKEIS